MSSLTPVRPSRRRRRGVERASNHCFSEEEFSRAGPLEVEQTTTHWPISTTTTTTHWPISTERVLSTTPLTLRSVNTYRNRERTCCCVRVMSKRSYLRAEHTSPTPQSRKYEFSLSPASWGRVSMAEYHNICSKIVRLFYLQHNKLIPCTKMAFTI